MKEWDADTINGICDCGGLIEAHYDSISAGEWKAGDGSSRLARYWKLLPLTESAPANYLARFFKPTPLYRSRALGEYFKIKGLWLKDETKNFTKTFKARDAFVSLLRFQEIGISEFVLCSTGNTAAAFCYAMRFAGKGMKAHLFFPKNTIIDFPVRTRYVAKTQFVSGTFEEAINAAKSYAVENNLAFEGGFANLGRREGSKTLAFEIAETKLEPDWYVQAIGSGTGAYSFEKGFSELVKLGAAKICPKILCVQPERCSPIVNSFLSGSELLDPKFVVKSPDSFATTLSNGNPSLSYPYVRKAILNSQGGVQKVSESEIAKALMLLFKLEHLACDPAVAVAVAGLMRSVEEEKIDRNSTIVLNVSGGLRRGSTRWA